MDIVKNYIANKLLAVVKSQGELVSKEQGEARIEVCKGCKFYGEVEPVPYLKMKGCTKCGCPLASKAYMKWIWRSNEHAKEPLDINEIIQLITLKQFDKSKFYKHLITCPFSKVNKWQDVDSNF